MKVQFTNLALASKATVVSMEYTKIADENGVEQLGVVYVINGMSDGEIAELTFRVYAPTELEQNESIRVYTNKANLEDESNKNLIFEEDTVDNKQGENVVPEDIYKKESETTYHQVQIPVLEVLKSSNPESGIMVKTGDTIIYHIQVKNIGSEVAENVIIRDAIPQFTSYVRNSAASDKKDTEITLTTLNGKETLIWIVEALEPNETVIVSFEVTVDKMETTGERIIKNTAQVKIPSTGEVPSESAKKDDGYLDTNEVEHTQRQEEPPVKTPVISPPKTGDRTNIELLLTLLAISSIIPICIIKKKRKQVTK